MKQQKLFEDWQFISQKILDLKSFIQNDFDRMITDKYIEKEEIKHSIPEFEDLFERNISQLRKLKEDIVLFMREKSE